jgi:2-deoxy-D-gluconate 3-dehydrogenase
LIFPPYPRYIAGTIMSRFTGKVVLVTGSSRGIGAAIARSFAGEGARVVGVARTASQLKIENYHAIDFDLGSASAGEMGKLIEGIVGDHGRIDALVNNAGIIRRAPAIDFSESDWNDVIRINLSSPFFLSQAVAKWWLKDEQIKARGRDGARLKIINIASLLSFQGGILVPAYAASKHGIAGLTKALANEWAPLGINVNAVAPGYVETENTAALRADPARSQAILARIPQGHWANPKDIAGACLFLASPDSDYVNGSVLNVDGGWLAR